MSENIEATKEGKRVRQDKVNLLAQVIAMLQDLWAWAKYSDEESEILEEEKQAITRGSVERVAQQRRQPSSATGGANWTAKVGESIIGDLARGEGGRFVSASNIRSMMGMLDRANISPNMFSKLQDVLAGSEIDAQTLSQLQTVGLVNEQGMVTGKGNDLVNAVGTGEPDNVKAIVKPKAKGKAGRGKKPPKPPKPTKEERERKNVEKISQQLVTNDRMKEEQIDAFNKFVKGEDVSKEALEDLQDLGILEIDSEGFFALNRFGKRLDNALEKGELRGAMDVLSQAKDARKALLKKEADNIEDTSEEIVDQGALSQQQMDAFLQLVEGVTLTEEDQAALLDTNLIELGEDDEIAFTEDGNQFIKALQDGVLDDALDILEFEIPEATAQNIADASTRLVEDRRISQEGMNAFNKFIADEELNETEVETLQDLNLLELSDAGLPILNSDARSLRAALRRGDFLRAAELIARAGKREEKQFAAFKMLGNNYFVTWTTNAYKDREKETFTLKSIQNYVSAHLENDFKGEYDYWHIPGSEFADITEQFVVDKFLVEIGQFKQNEVGNAFKQLFVKYPEGHPEFAPYGWGCSQRYVYQKQDRDDGVYEWFDKEKSTILPLEEAANIFTLAEFFGEKSMAITDKQKENVKRIGAEVGMPDLLERILSAGKERTAVLDEQGIESKQAVLKTEAGEQYPARCYAYVPENDKPSTWKLRMCAVGTTEITREQLGAAAAAFSPGGHRGKKVELPREDVAPTKQKIRSEYRKLGVKLADMPTSVKSLEWYTALKSLVEELEMDELLEKLATASKSMHEDLKVQMDGLLEKMQQQEEDQVGLLRQLMELIAQVADEELRTQLEELVTAMLPQEEEDVEMEIENEVVDEEKETAELQEEKSTDSVVSDSVTNIAVEVDEEKVVERLVKALNLEGLSEMLEKHDKALEEGVPQLQAAVVELVEKIKQLTDDVKMLKVSDEQKIAEKQARFTPYWGGFRASQVAATVLDDKEAKNFAKPELPTGFKKVSNAILGGN